MNQNVLDFSAPVVDPQVERWTDPPIAPGSHSSYTGARVAVRTWTRRQSVILQLLASGSKSRQELSTLSGYPLASVCSAVGALLKQQEIEVDHGNWDIAQWADGETKRERLSLRRRR